MKIGALISTMNKTKKELDTLIKNMKVKKTVVINQITKDNIQLTNESDNQKKIISVREKGLSKSRNLAIKNSDSDICIIADDDLYYEKDYTETITNAYQKYKNADIIAFVVDNEDIKSKKPIFRESRVSYLKSMKLQSVQLTFKRKSIIENNIKFDELYGAGSKYYWGEENIFLFDCLRKKLKIYYIPQKIATLKISESSWDKSISRKNSKIRGIIFYRMTKVFYPILIIQFAFRKRKKYIKEMSAINNIKYMFEGVKEYKEQEKK